MFKHFSNIFNFVLVGKNKSSFEGNLIVQMSCTIIQNSLKVSFCLIYVSLIHLRYFTFCIFSEFTLTP